jgi:hypothetical protein
MSFTSGLLTHETHRMVSKRMSRVYAQTTPVQNAVIAFDEQHRRAVEQNPPGVELTMATANWRSAFHFSEMIARFTRSAL